MLEEASSGFSTEIMRRACGLYAVIGHLTPYKGEGKELYEVPVITPQKSTASLVSS